MRLRTLLHTAYFATVCSACLAPSDGHEHRSFFESAPIAVAGELTSEFSSAQRENDITTRSLFAVQITTDIGEIAPLIGGEIFADLRSNRAQTNSVESLQGASALDNPDSDQVAELFYARELSEFGRIRVGLLDGNSEFAAIEGAAQFFNPAPATSPSIASIPTWPFSAPGFEFVLEADDTLMSAGLGIYDRGYEQSFREEIEPPGNGQFAVAELRAGGLDTAAGFRGTVGLWHDTSTLERLDGIGDQNGASGGYATLEQWITRDSNSEGERGLRAFALFGQSDDRVIENSTHAAAGIDWLGPWRDRTDDSAGLMVSRVNPSAAIADADNETTVEAFYRAQLTGVAAVTVSVQAIDNIGGSRGDDEIVFGLRGSLSF